MSHVVSVRVTWTTCPVCGGELAVGWDRRGHPPGEVPVEFDCVHHCELTLSQAVRAAAEPVRKSAWRGSVNGMD